MSDNIIRLSAVEVQEDEIEAAVQVLRSGQIREGARCRQFEEDFAAKTGARYALAVSSGTAALHLAYLALVPPGSEVLVPAFTFFATASMVVAAGSTPVFCDVDPRTFTLDVDDAESKITDKARAIAPVHIFGNPCDIDAITGLARRHNLRVIWDAAQAHYAAYGGKDIAGFDDAATFSFYASKNMTTGEGGMLTTNDQGIYDSARLLRSQGQAQKYRHTVLGYNYRMTDFQAAIGCVQLQKLGEWLERRRHNAGLLRKGLSGLKGIQAQELPPQGEHAYHQFGVVLDSMALGITRDGFVSQLNERGVEAGTHYPIPLHKQPVFQELYGDSSLPVSERIADNVVTLPVHHRVSDEDAERVVEAVRGVLSGVS